MTPLEEAHIAIFGCSQPKGMPEEKLAQRVLEGLSAKFHGRKLEDRCLNYIYQRRDDFSELVLWWADRDWNNVHA
ncbi:MAG: hypothetical protein HYT38_01595 [Candidatus Sungbacteria bacterium]|uniref:Uncharacterized protein n=1 Tax=Candidatus Sungiibacteriota bacterium TaxID=2750080 RepID=A0A931YDR8_9BACT|nr:hypothetical protein [Candidatus Sungbacteria bacterium]MBI2466085.1 hypothetical protein [Candidatus Sungbacteria bacterium]